MVSTRIPRTVRAGGGQSLRRSHGVQSRLVCLCEAAVLVLVPAAAWVPAAEASPASCAATGLGSLCNETDRSGLRVGEVHAWLSALGPSGAGGSGSGDAWICNKELKVRGTLADGRGYERSSVARCGWGRVSVRFGVNRMFRNGDYVCVAVREYGPQSPWEPDEACTRIRR
jgi:hypothetical protein